ncbi:hypothetical protein GCM10009535_21590 [Streptomyces thermocarboxydovorans]|uniref:Uncharacterized protein n=1 Tax=Streptomyces thermocarboxydovorans TaxID=59298 RepID=A0ABN1HF83_9ACTN
MRRKGERQGAKGEAEDDVEAVLDELYALPPSGFVPRREERAAEARSAGRADDARRIRAARRPTLAAWAANLLRRSRPEEAEQFLELGRALREAFTTLDPAGLKELSAQRRRIVAELSRQAAQLARDAGHPLSDSVQRDVEETLRAVLADPEAADRWAEGRLESALTPPAEFAVAGGGTGAAASKRSERRPPAPSKTTTPPAPKKDELAERRRQRQEQARAAAEAAEERVRERRGEREAAETAAEQARERCGEAERRVADLEEQLGAARAELERAEHEQRAAEQQARAAAGALDRAEREAKKAAREAKRLAARAR